MIPIHNIRSSRVVIRITHQTGPIGSVDSCTVLSVVPIYTLMETCIDHYIFDRECEAF